MAKHQRLNHEQHAAIKIDPRFSAELGDGINKCLVVPSEFGSLQKEYPMFLELNPDNNQFQAMAFLGFEQGENLYLGADGQWHANYVPATIAKGPFLIGLTENDAKIDIDVEHPKVSQGDGHTMFTDEGKPTEYLNYISDVMSCLFDGIKQSQSIYQLWQKHGLIEGVDININFDDDKQFSANHLYTINHKNLAELPAEALYELNQQGALDTAFWMISSLNNVQHLMTKRHR